MEAEPTITKSIEDILTYIGEDPNREGLKGTPGRMVKSWKELFAGYGQNPKDVLSKEFTETGGYDEMVILKNIEFYSTCEHHFLPFFGKCHIAYIPNGKVVGVSKLARLVETFSRRLQIQERMTGEMAAAINEHLVPLGVGVVVEAQHFCMTARGVRKQEAVMVTSALMGVFKDWPETRAEFMGLIK